MSASKSPNHALRPIGLPVTAIVLHYTGMQTAALAQARLCDPIAKVSAHYLVDEDGQIEQLVAESDIAWHAGLSAWRAMDGLNPHSIGIEIVNPGHEWGYRAFPACQIDAIINLLMDLLDRHPVPAANIVGHSDIAPARKQDPGELFPWHKLAAAGIGRWPDTRPCPVDDVAARALLSSIGYRLDQQATSFGQVISAFQQRYRPLSIDGRLDPETMALLSGLARVIDHP